MLELGLRNIFRHRTRSAVALSAIAFSTIALMLSAGFVEWIFWAMRQAATEAGMGHVRVMRPGFLEEGTADPFAFLMPQKSKEFAGIEATAHVKAIAPRLAFAGLVSKSETTLAFVGTGIDADREAVVSKNLAFDAGENLASGTRDAVILGRGLARQLGASVGDTVVLLVNARGGGVNAVEAKVRGIFATQIKAADDVGLRIPIAMAQKLLRVSGAHEWVVLLDDPDRVDETVRQVASQLDAKRFKAVPWYDLADFYNKTVQLLTSQMGVVRFIVGIIIVLGISNMLVMNVMERTGEIGTLMAIGSRRGRIVALFVSEGFFLALIGGVAGISLAFVLARVISAVGIPMPPPPGRSVGYSAEILLTWSSCLVAFLVTFGTTLLASVYPAWKASRLVIVDALRHNR